MNRPIAFVAALVLMGTTVGVAQQKRAVTTADYDRAVKMLAPALNGLVVGDSVNATWLPDGRFWYARTTLTGTENIVIDPVNKTRETVATPPAGGQASPGAGGRGGRGGGGGRGGAGRGGGVALVEDVRPQRHGAERPAPAVDVARRQEGAVHLRLESLGEGRRHRPGTAAHDRRREGLRVRDEQRRMGDQRRAFAVVVARQQEDRHAAAGRAESRRDVPGRDAGQRRPSGPPRLEVSAPRRSRRRHDQPRHHRRRDRQDDAPALGAGFPPRHVGRQPRHGRIPVEPGRVEARVRVDRSVPQELHRQARRHHERRSPHALHRDGEDARADARAVADSLGHQRGPLVHAARRHRADVPLRSEDRPGEEPDHVRRRADHADRQARSPDADDVVRGGRQGEGTGSRTSRTSTGSGSTARTTFR